MQQRAKPRLDSDDEENDDVQAEVTETIEKFVQARHVQTLKYLQHVIDENRHLRLHIEHLKRRQNDPNPSPAVVDPIDPEDPPITEIPLETDEVVESPEVLLPVKRFNHVGTNTLHVEDFEGQCQTLKEELENGKREHQLQREEFRRELERVDEQNVQLTHEITSLQQQLIVVQQHNQSKQAEIQRLSSMLTEQRSINESSSLRMNKLEQTNRLLTTSLTSSEETRLHLEGRLEQRALLLEDTEHDLAAAQALTKTQEKQMQSVKSELHSCRERLDVQLKTVEELKEDKEELNETIQALQEQLRQRTEQLEEKNTREKQQTGNFKEFVQVKRALQLTQQENEQLKFEVKKLQLRLLNKSE